MVLSCRYLALRSAVAAAGRSLRAAAVQGAAPRDFGQPATVRHAWSESHGDGVALICHAHALEMGTAMPSRHACDSNPCLVGPNPVSITAPHDVQRSEMPLTICFSKLDRGSSRSTLKSPAMKVSPSKGGRLSRIVRSAPSLRSGGRYAEIIRQGSLPSCVWTIAWTAVPSAMTLELMSVTLGGVMIATPPTGPPFGPGVAGEAATWQPGK